MTWVSNPFIRFKCAGCGRQIERAINANSAAAEISDLRDGPPLTCAECHAKGEQKPLLNSFGWPIDTVMCDCVGPDEPEPQPCHCGKANRLWFTEHYLAELNAHKHGRLFSEVPDLRVVWVHEKEGPAPPAPVEYDLLEGMEWWNNLSDDDRKRWAAKAGNTGRAADAWELFKSEGRGPK